ncbi:starch-binding domain-containing protein 1 [Physeter macrocephalus]|uniref:Starch-binding domain-containing protein 1 n=1 Tax=Physeter macrocephalus TaxID=9755 RepID=A0A2Y9FJS6_PHYMC|nr:starch-binding domain-containing protein 1 [Physeter catodon]|eukprot:XP_007125110.1 starch-binding domain-containing protein 1 [Physeter catodon]
MGAVWSALLVGGGLAGALFVWLLRDTGKEGDAEQGKDASPGEAAAPGDDQGGGGGLSPGPSRRELVTKPEHLQESNGCLVSKTKGPGDLQEAAWRLQSPSGEGSNHDNSRAHVPSGQLPDTQSLATSETSNSTSYPDVSRNESLGSPIGEWGFQKGQEKAAQAAPHLAEKLPSSNLLLDRAEEAASLAQLDSRARADHVDWEMVTRRSPWGDVGLGGSLESPVLSSKQGEDYDRRTLVEARGQEVDVKPKRVGTVSPESPQVSVSFQVHYITRAGVQCLAVTGDHESLGRWNTYIPLQCSEDGLWSHSVPLPADTVVEWKFVVVENGEVTRWEECSNRFLETGHEDKVVHKWWGIH